MRLGSGLKTTLASAFGSELLGVIGLMPSSAYGISHLDIPRHHFSNIGLVLCVAVASDIIELSFRVCTRGQCWLSGIVVARVSPCVITCQPFKLESPNLNHKSKTHWLRYLLFMVLIDLDLDFAVNYRLAFRLIFDIAIRVFTSEDRYCLSITAVPTILTKWDVRRVCVIHYLVSWYGISKHRRFDKKH